MGTSPKYCRLCLEISDDSMVNVSETFQNSSIASILTKHFWFQVLENDDFSEWLCQICWIQIKNFHDFYKRLEDIHNSRNRNESIQLTVLKEDPDLNIVKHEASDTDADLTTATDMVDDVEICKEEIREYEYDVNRQGDSEPSDDGDQRFDKKTKTKPHFPSQSEKRLQDAQIRQFFTMKCELCSSDVKFEDLSQALKHYRKVHKIRGYLMCCGKKYKFRHRIMDHVQFHVHPNAYQCHYCDRTYPHKRSLRTHMKRHFSLSTLTEQKCSTCSKTFSSSSGLQHHIEVKHTTKMENELLPCDKCSKAFKNVRALKNHLRAVHLTQQVVCEICARLFKSKTTLRIHVVNEHPTTTQPRVKCDICGAWFKHIKYLRDHLKRHEEWTRKVDPVKCQICDKMVKNETALAKHIRYVHTEKRHQCTMCPKSLKTASSLKKHLAVHTRDNLYACRYCDKKWKSNSNMYTHMKKVHFDDWARDNPKGVRLKESFSIG